MFAGPGIVLKLAHVGDFTKGLGMAFWLTVRVTMTTRETLECLTVARCSMETCFVNWTSLLVLSSRNRNPDNTCQTVRRFVLR